MADNKLLSMVLWVISDQEGYIMIVHIEYIMDHYTTKPSNNQKVHIEKGG